MSEVLQEILKKINDDDKVGSSNIIEKIKSELQQHNVDMYNEWKDNGFDINANSFDGSNLLCLVSGSGYIELAKLLIEKGANVNAQDNEGKTPLHLAVSSSNLDIIGVPIFIRRLIDGEDENVNLQDNIVEILIEKGANINIQDNEGKTPLHLAVSNSSLGAEGIAIVVETLIGRDAKVDIQDNEGKTPLHLAVSNSDLPNIFAALSLIIRGANVNIQDHEGRTPLHLAVSNSEFPNLEVIRSLIKKGANVNTKDNEGRTPLDYAISSEKEELIKILTEKTLLSDEGQISLEQEAEISLEDQYEDTSPYYFSSDEYREVPLESAAALI
ncbi:ankyrin repeat domain-containing protein [Wolbachia endosymbiont (group B) of Athalia cordata]|uniref:ankyrin repeat domain-containing protein n=1 Tax=Wolbachia endosymbiont (group B) of Athalia cordata TaxID=2953986 RepID=UPI00222E7051|nr:ankyrin repeat domain-containing protein [Wolbachia endosymbiont (group B) of Athalia cordata]